MGKPWTREEYFVFHDDCCTRMKAITKAKNADYTAGADNPFSNFEGVAIEDIATTEQGFLTRMYDKFKRVSSFWKLGVLQVKEESVEDTLLDLANYCILMAGYIRSKRRQTEN